MSRNSAWDSGQSIDWLLNEGRFLKNLDDVALQLGQAMLASGAPLWRLRLSMRTLHPLAAAVSAVWERDSGDAEIYSNPHGLENRSDYLGSPLEIIARTRAEYRKQLTGKLTDAEPGILHTLKARGATDYFGVPMHYSSDTIAILVLTTDGPDGFTDYDLGHFRKIASVLAPIAEVYSATQVSQAVADTYLGPRTGRLVLDGQITRGHVEKINAAILLSDIRDWTGINNRMAAEDALALANSYFEVIAESIETCGGEILKFMGDGILAIFPTDAEHIDGNTACENGLNAAKLSLQKAGLVAELENLQFGLGLHYGEVLYGNIGSETRLDFTVLGPAVNVAARIEGLCASLGKSLLFSEEFAGRITESTEIVTSATLKGQDGKVNILTTPGF